MRSGDGIVPKRKQIFTGVTTLKEWLVGSTFLAIRREGVRPATKRVLIVELTPVPTL